MLGAGHEKALLEKDLDLKTHYSLSRCADHAITMTSLAFEELSRQNPGVGFVQTEPGAVQTNIAKREGGIIGAVMDKSWWIVSRVFTVVPLEEAGERGLYAATAAGFRGRGVKAETEAAVGSDGVAGSGAYLVVNQSQRVGNEKVLKALRERGVGKIVWEHTRAMFRQAVGDS